MRVNAISSLAMVGLALAICQCSDEDGTPAPTGGAGAAATGGQLTGSGGSGPKAQGGAEAAGAGAAGASGDASAAGAGMGGADAGPAGGSGGSPPGSEGGYGGTDAGAGGTEACPAFEACTDVGGRGNQCGGVIANSRFLTGTGFDEYEGARVVTERGFTRIRDGAFSLYEGTYAGCGERTTRYRIDVSENGRCDEEDLVYELEGSGVSLQVTSGEPGTPIPCEQFGGDARDLEISVAETCLPRCGALQVSLLDEDGAELWPADWIFLDSPPYSGHGVAAALAPGDLYSVRYVWSCFASGCNGSTRYEWLQPFTASEGVNRLEFSLESL